MTTTKGDPGMQIKILEKINTLAGSLAVAAIVIGVLIFCGELKPGCGAIGTIAILLGLARLM